MILSQLYADHSAELSTIEAYIESAPGGPSEDATRLGITAEEVIAISALKGAFDTAYATYINPTTHNAISVNAMKIANNNAFTVIFPLRQQLKKGKVPLTPDDYANLGIHEDKTTRTPSERPTQTPLAVVVKAEPKVLTVDATEQTTEGANRTATLNGNRIFREIAVVAPGTEPTEGDFYALDSVGRSRFQIVFNNAQVGMNVYIRLAYENSAGRGPISRSVKAIII